MVGPSNHTSSLLLLPCSPPQCGQRQDPFPSYPAYPHICPRKSLPQYRGAGGGGRCPRQFFTNCVDGLSLCHLAPLAHAGAHIHLPVYVSWHLSPSLCSWRWHLELTLGDSALITSDFSEVLAREWRLGGICLHSTHLGTCGGTEQFSALLPLPGSASGRSPDWSCGEGSPFFPEIATPSRDQVLPGAKSPLRCPARAR